MSEAPAAAPPAAAHELVALWHLFGVFFFIGATSFGGGVVAYLREHIVERQKWLDDEEFMASLEIGQTLPGLIATNVSIIVGNRLRGPRGSLAALLGILLPGSVVVFALGLIYSEFKRSPGVTALLHGVAAAAVGLLLEVTMQIGRKQLLNWRDLCFLIPVFIAVGVLHISLLVVLVTIAPFSVWMHRPSDQMLADHAQEHNLPPPGHRLAVAGRRLRAQFNHGGGNDALK
jgi:chromate transporter